MFMLIGSRQRLSTLTDSPALAINDFQVSQVTTANSHGVTIDDKLDWSGHIEKVTKKVASGIGALKRIRHLIPRAILHLIYQALIQPHFDYCNIVWGNCGITLQNKLQKLENRAASVLTYSNYDVDAGHLFKLLGWKFSLPAISKSYDDLQVSARVGSKLRYFERWEIAYNLRGSENKLDVTLPRTNYYKNSFGYSGAILWNSLPRNVREAESLGQFKRLLKEELWGTAFVESSFLFEFIINIYNHIKY